MSLRLPSIIPSNIRRCLVARAAITGWAIFAISAQLTHADVTSVGSVTPVPPSNGGTFPTTTTLTVGEGDDNTDNDIWGFVTVDDGTLLQYGSLIIGDEDGYFGQVNVSGNFLNNQITQFNFSAQGGTSNPAVQVGREGTGWLNVGGGSWMTLTNTNSDMSIGSRITGIGYTKFTDQFTLATIGRSLFVGQNGIGNLDILNGAIVRTLSTSSTSFIGIGVNDLGVGTVRVDGQGSVLRAGSNLVVSGNAVTSPTEFGQGTLKISNGGVVDVDNGITLFNSPTITVGPRGRIELDNGTLIGFAPTTGFGTTVNGFLGGDGLVRGSVQFTQHAFLESHAGDFLRFTGEVDNQGSVTIDNSEMWFLSGFTNNAPGLGVAPGRISLENGTVRFSEPLANDGVISSASGANNIFGEIINNERVVVARDTVASFYGTFINLGTVTVLPAGNALFLADISFVGLSSLDVGLGNGNIVGGPLSATGSAALAGRLNIELDAGFVPEAGTSFEILSADGGVSGAFEHVTFPTLPDGLEFGLVYGPNSVTAEVRLESVAIGLPGDYNNDGTVNAADYVVWRNNLGSPNSMLNDDTPGVGQDDYTRWKANFGQSAFAGSGGFAAAPEPSSTLLLLVALAAAASFRRR